MFSCHRGRDTHTPYPPPPGEDVVMMIANALALMKYRTAALMFMRAGPNLIRERYKD